MIQNSPAHVYFLIQNNFQKSGSRFRYQGWRGFGWKSPMCEWSTTIVLL